MANPEHLEILKQGVNTSFLIFPTGKIMTLLKRCLIDCFVIRKLPRKKVPQR
jgi:hypothetical protein